MNTLNFFSGKSLQDIVKGLRAQPTAEGRNAYAAQALQECRTELASVDPALKANAASKVAHFRMLGYDDANLGDDDTSFHVIESMASAQFRYKRQGTLAAARLLSSNSRVLLLATNTLKKELKNPEPYVSGLALGAISCFVSRELARDLLPDVMQSLQSSKPYVRKRAMLCLYRMCQAYPEGLHEAYDAMRARLEDPDASVVGCAVNAVCELSRSNAKSVLPLTPQLFRLLTSSSNNWMLIKIVKLYSALLAVEPRLARKLLEPLVHNIKTTSAKSLLFECISTVTRALRHVPTAPEALVNDVVNVCAAKLKEFVLDSDQNLKYLGLVGFIELTKSHPTDMIVLCLGDADVTVRLRALELLAGIATPKSVTGIVKCILEHVHRAGPGRFRDAVAPSVILACVGPDNDLSRLLSCEWYVAVLMDLARCSSHAHGDVLASQLVLVATSVPDVQAFAAETCAKLILEERAVGPEVLAAAAFVACEFASSDMGLAEADKLVRALLDPGFDCSELPRATLIHNAVKLALLTGRAELKATTARLLHCWSSSASTEIQSRAVLGLELLKADAPDLHLQRLGPVHPSAQLAVPVPEDLNVPLAMRTDEAPSGLQVSFRGKRVLVPTQMAESPRARSDPSVSAFYLPSSNLVQSAKASANRADKPAREEEEAEERQQSAAPPRGSAEPKLWSTAVAGAGTRTAVQPAGVRPSAALLARASGQSRNPLNPNEITLADIDVTRPRVVEPKAAAAGEDKKAEAKKASTKKKKKIRKEQEEGVVASSPSVDDSVNLMQF